MSVTHYLGVNGTDLRKQDGLFTSNKSVRLTDVHDGTSNTAMVGERGGSTPAYYGAGDVFAMPCRTRHGGLDVEGLGIVYLEASATGLPVVAGDSGGAPEAVREGETGYVVDGRDVAQVADRVATLLGDPVLARRMGAAGRAWVEREWRWDAQAERMRAILTG